MKLTLEDRGHGMLLKNKFGEIRAGWAISLVVVLIIASQVIAGGLLPEDAESASLALKMGVTLLYALISIVGGLALFRWLYGRGPRHLGLSLTGWLTELLHGMVMGTVAMGLVFAALIITGQAQVQAVDLAKLTAPALVVELFSLSIFAFSEELLARGFIMTSMKTTRRKFLILAFPALLFSSIHFFNPGVT